MIGPGRPLDTDRYFVVCNASLGSPHGSTSPASKDTRTGEPYRLAFPFLSVEDIASSSQALLLSMGVERLKAVVGSSLGGMTALAYAVLFPDGVERVVSISAASAAAPFAIALRSIQRESIRSDPDWKGGLYDRASPPIRGMRLGRKLGVASYRSPAEWTARFDRRRVENPGGEDGFGASFDIEAYLEHQAEKFVHVFDANCWLYLSRAMDLFDVAEHGPSLVEALSKIRARIHVIGVESDILFPIEQQEALAAALKEAGRDVTLTRLPSTQGHDSFLIDYDRFAPAVSGFLKEP